jgi:hypothetical protein
MARHKGFRKAKRRAKHGASPYEQWRGTPIAKKYAGTEKCTSYKNAKVCVYGAKYGFSAWLVSKEGKKGAPLSVPSSARTPHEALKAATREVRRVSRISRSK